MSSRVPHNTVSAQNTTIIQSSEIHSLNTCIANPNILNADYMNSCCVPPHGPYVNSYIKNRCDELHKKK